MLTNKAAVSPWIVTVMVVVASVFVCAMAWHKVVQTEAKLRACHEDTVVQVAVEKKKIAADIDEKYRADRISYEVMARQMARQQNSMRETVGQE
jgi:Tfp pilus assembly protein PilO